MEIKRYLGRQADLDRRPLITGSEAGIRRVVVIPVLAEERSLYGTLDSLSRCGEADLDQTLIVCVVNNRAAPDESESRIRENLATLGTLRAWVDGADGGGRCTMGDGALRLALVDAASPGNELASHEGVGTARKIGLDLGLRLLHENGMEDGLLINLDADTLVEPNYLAEIGRFFSDRGSGAAVVAYEHPLDGPEEERDAILCYELFLRYHLMGLQLARSPYAYTAIGSTIVCTAAAYASVSGMSRKRAGEDFYFLEKLAKTVAVDSITGTKVFPAARPSTRVPFGTGPRVDAYMAGSREGTLFFHPASYEVLGGWLSLISDRADEEAAQIYGAASTVCPALPAFLDEIRFRKIWPRLQENAPGPNILMKQFHRWFDALKTLQLLNHLRDNGYPKQEMYASVRRMLRICGFHLVQFDWRGIESDPQIPVNLLGFLRRRSGNL